MYDGENKEEKLFKFGVIIADYFAKLSIFLDFHWLQSCQLK